MPKTIRVALVMEPDSAHRDSYLKALAETEEAASVAVADRTGKTFDRAKEVLGAKLDAGTFTDLKQMLDKAAPQMALVTLPALDAPPVIDTILDAGCHVLAEKPSCVRAEDFAPLVKKAQQKHRHLMLALANRLHAPIQEARKLIKDGALGKLYGIDLYIIADQTRLKSPTYPKQWVASKAKAGGGHLIWLGIHWLDLACYMTGQHVKQVAGFTSVVGGQPIDTEDSAVLALRFDGGMQGTMHSGYYLDKGYHSHFVIWGEHGWLRCTPVEDTPLEWYSTKGTDKPQVQRFEYPKGNRGYTPFVRACVRASAGLEMAPINGEDGLHVLQTIFAAYRAAESGKAQMVG